jgi:hypothetical protein
MKKIIILLTVLTASHVFAEGEKNKPCLEIKKACESAGFSKGKHKEGKGLHKDCMQKLAAGEVVAGVSISADVISACKKKRDDHKAKK